MDLSVIIITYNSQELIGGLLDHLAKELSNSARRVRCEVIVLDNASVDGTVELIRREYSWVKLIVSRENLGFAAGNNLAAGHARGRYLVLLNPDAIPTAGSLARGVALMDATPGVGLGGGALFGSDGTAQPSSRMFPTLRDEVFTISGLAARYPHSKFFARLDRRWADPGLSAEVDWIPGAFVFIPALVFARLGGFDERFFMYYEEVDLCRRLRALGLGVVYWPHLKAVHIGGASARTIKKERVSSEGGQLQSWRMRSALLYYRKHHGLLAALGLYAIESVWHRLRQVKAICAGQTLKAADLRQHCAQLYQAWRDTRAGRLSPIRPW